MTKEILMLAEQLYVDRMNLINKAIHDNVEFSVPIDDIIKVEAKLSLKAAGMFYQVKGEIETEVGK